MFTNPNLINPHFNVNKQKIWHISIDIKHQKLKKSQQSETSAVVYVCILIYLSINLFRLYLSNTFRTFGNLGVALLIKRRMSCKKKIERLNSKAISKRGSP